MSYWAGTTKLETAQIAECARNMLPFAFGGLRGALVRKNTTWGPIGTTDGGVFSGLDERPAWSARAEYRRKNVGAFCDVRVYENGDQRLVTLDLGKSFGGGGVAKELAAGMIKTLQISDPSLPSIDSGPSGVDVLKGSMKPT